MQYIFHINRTRGWKITFGTSLPWPISCLCEGRKAGHGPCWDCSPCKYQFFSFGISFPMKFLKQIASHWLQNSWCGQMRGAVVSFALEPQPSPSPALADCFAATAASRTVSPSVSSWTFPSKVYFAFLLVVPRCVAFHLLTLNPYADLSGACRLRQLPMPHLPRIAADVPGHIPSSSHVSRASASSPGSVLCTMQLP